MLAEETGKTTAAATVQDVQPNPEKAVQPTPKKPRRRASGEEAPQNKKVKREDQAPAATTPASETLQEPHETLQTDLADLKETELADSQETLILPGCSPVQESTGAA